jgi:hypothetical protein
VVFLAGVELGRGFAGLVPPPSPLDLVEGTLSFGTLIGSPLALTVTKDTVWVLSVNSMLRTWSPLGSFNPTKRW